MKHLHKLLFAIIGCFLLSGCSSLSVLSVRQVDLDSWVGVPVEALDLHSFWVTIPMVRTITDSGIEIRIYVNKRIATSCFENAGINLSKNNTVSYASFLSLQNCISGSVGCDNIFYIKDGKVMEYVPVGNCYTDESVQPEERYKRLIDK